MEKFDVFVEVTDYSNDIVYNFDDNEITIQASSVEDFNKKLSGILEHFDTSQDIDNIYEDKEKERARDRSRLANATFKVSELRLYDVSENSIKMLEKYSDDIDELSLGLLDINQLLDLFKNFNIGDNVKIRTRYNDGDTCSKNEFNDLMNYLSGIKEYISRFDLSPLEICIFAYDLIREKEYKYSDEDKILDEKDLSSVSIFDGDKWKEQAELGSYSRSLFKTYKTDSIVCAGFAKMYSAIINMFGIESEEIGYSSENNGGHEANIVYLDDPKYHEHVVMEVDPTWGRVYDEDGNYDYQRSLYNYSSFGCTLAEAMRQKAKIEMESDLFNSSLIGKILMEMKSSRRMLEMSAPSFIMENGTRLIYNNLTKLKTKTDNPTFLKAYEKISNAYDLYKSGDPERKGDTYLSEGLDDLSYFLKYSFRPSSLANALEQVKKIEHSIDYKKYPYDINKIIEVLNKRFNLNGEFEKKDIMPFMFQHRILSDVDDMTEARMKFISMLHKRAQDQVDENPVIYKSK